MTAGVLGPGELAAVAAALVGLAVSALPGRPRLPRPAARPPTSAPRGRGGAAPVDAALLLDLVAAVVAAGAPPSAALRAVCDVVREAGAPAHADVLEALALAPSPARPAGAPPDLAPAVDALRRALWIAEQTGAPVSALLRSSAEELRRGRQRAAALAAARLGVRVVAPLGLCTLPAFALLAVAPVLLSLGAGLLG
ncbi:type II secretion system F family protein [Quadrisphaera sp. KR29]|uniref:type II secretion system F family protein n=1 Tax=Quadrisphaera sp. KR29 TaxID=3461391 RepID=UPI004044A5E2